jgi:glycogen debranching enzyme
VSDDQIVWEKFVAKILVDLRGRVSHTTLEEEIENVQKVVGRALEAEYGYNEVDLVWVTWEGKLGEDEDTPEGWGMSAEEIWDRLPGDTQEEKREFIERWAREHREDD